MDEKTLEKFKDRISEMSNWADELKKVEKEKEKKRVRKKVSLAMIAANNH